MKKRKAKAHLAHLKSRWSRKDKLLLIERLEMYVSAGLPVDRALAAAGEGSSRKQAMSLDRVRLTVESGQMLSVALAHEIHVPLAVVGLIACGESSGSVALALRSAHSLLEREDELLKKCLSSLTYPIVIGLAAVGLTIGLVRGVMPQIIPLLLGLHTDLPILTKIVIAVSQGFTSYGLCASVGGALIAVAAIAAYGRLYRFRLVAHQMILSTPLIGGLAERYALAIFFQSMGALVESGMPADVAFVRTMPTLSLLPLRVSFERAAPRIIHGESLHIVLGRGLPSYISPLIAAGEASGSLGSALSRAAGILDRELEHSLKRLTALIEPVMMLGLGAAVGSIALSIMMPIYDISKALQH